MPYFSIVIPTRNRPALLANAVASVLEQDFVDFELIVSDNSDPAQAAETHERLRDARKDKRVRYLRPDRVLPMTEHWELAVRQSCGSFTGILTDRSAYRLYALRTIHRACEVHQPDVVTFLTDNIFGEDRPFRIKLRPLTTQSQIIKTDEMVLNFSRSIFSKRAPRMLNSFCRTDRLQQLVQKYGSIFTGLSPDYSFCFRILDSVETVLSLDARLVLVGGESQSNGGAFRTNRMNDARRDFLTQMTVQQKWLEYGPIPGFISIIGNAILREYEIARSVQRSGRFAAIDKEAFYMKTIAEISTLATRGFDQQEALDALEEYRRNYRLPASSSRGTAYNNRKVLLRTLREGLRDRFLLITSSIASKFKRPRQDGPIVRIGRWCTFDTLMDALRYDAREAGSATLS